MRNKRLLIVAFIIFLFLLIFLFPQKTTAFYYQDIPMTCENNCQPSVCDQNAPTDPCCQQIKATGDPFACPWPQRGWCNQSECASIPDGVNRERCGAPKEHWCEICHGSCCLNSDNTLNHIPEFPTPDFSNGCPSTIVWAPGHGQSKPNPTQPPRVTHPPSPTRQPPSIATPTPYYIAVTATPMPFVTPPINPTVIIIYITATPNPNQPEIIPTYSSRDLVHTIPQNTNSGSTLFSNVGGFVKKSFNNVTPVFQNIIAKIHDFLTHVAP